MATDEIEELLLQALDELAPLRSDADIPRARICEALRQIATPGATPIAPFIGFDDVPELPEITSSLLRVNDGDRVDDVAGCIWEYRGDLWHPSTANRGEPRSSAELLARYARIVPLR